MARYKISATVISAAVLAACTPPTYYGDLDNERHVARIVCKNVAPINSNIRRKTCRLERQLTFQERKDILRMSYQQTSRLGGPVQHTGSVGAGGVAEGHCGGARGGARGGD